jgi:hypothetical protein
MPAGCRPNGPNIPDLPNRDRTLPTATTHSYPPRPHTPNRDRALLTQPRPHTPTHRDRTLLPNRDRTLLPRPHTPTHRDRTLLTQPRPHTPNRDHTLPTATAHSFRAATPRKRISPWASHSSSFEVADRERSAPLRSVKTGSYFHVVPLRAFTRKNCPAAHCFASTNIDP